MFREKFITLCAYCRNIKDDSGETEEVEWVNWEDYLIRKNGITLSHGCCPTCFEKIKVEWKL
jgi:hypothetical protein